jgi:hypothetical protein
MRKLGENGEILRRKERHHANPEDRRRPRNGDQSSLDLQRDNQAGLFFPMPTPIDCRMDNAPMLCPVIL